ncbi:hypothetical protein, partial [Planktotalea sp.]|uniref:hypothetical protein n=1 Tax=Planktotalea sp. TaxID=2029877 RepID=UPI003F6CD023
MLANISLKTGLFGLCVLLSACAASQEDTTTSSSDGPEGSGPNTGDNVERVTGTGAQTGVGFGTSQFPTTRTGLAGANGFVAQIGLRPISPLPQTDLAYSHGT